MQDGGWGGAGSGIADAGEFLMSTPPILDDVFSDPPLKYSTRCCTLLSPHAGDHTEGRYTRQAEPPVANRQVCTRDAYACAIPDSS